MARKPKMNPQGEWNDLHAKLGVKHGRSKTPTYPKKEALGEPGCTTPTTLKSLGDGLYMESGDNYGYDAAPSNKGLKKKKK